MKVLNIHDPHNTFIRTVLPYGSGWFKRDGNEFARQAGYATDYYEAECNAIVTNLVIPMDKKKPYEKRWWLNKQLRILANDGEFFDRINFFMHGAKYNLNRKMYSMKPGKDVNTVSFCDKLSNIAAPGCGIVFYSCKTAAVDGGFAHTVSMETGRNIIGHLTSGHTTRNPWKSMFYENSFHYQTSRSNLWIRGGGIKQMKELMLSHINAPFRFVEEVLVEE